MSKIRSHLESLHTLTGGERNQTAAMMKFDRTTERALAMLETAHKSVLDHSWHDVNVQDSQQILAELVADLRVVSRNQSETQRESKDSERRYRRLVQQAIFVGVNVISGIVARNVRKGYRGSWETELLAQSFGYLTSFTLRHRRLIVRPSHAQPVFIDCHDLGRF
jgi:hypothetical protein